MSPKKVINKAAKATGEFIWNKIADIIMKLEATSRNVAEIIIPPDKIEEI